VTVITDAGQRRGGWLPRGQVLLALPTWRAREIDEALDRLVDSDLVERKAGPPGSEVRGAMLRTSPTAPSVDTNAHLQLEVYRARLKAMIATSAEDDRAFMLAHYADQLPGGVA